MHNYCSMTVVKKAKVKGNVLLSLSSVCLCSWGKEEEEESGAEGGPWQLAILPVRIFLLSLTVSPLVATPPTPPDHKRWWVGNAGSHTGNRKSWHKEPEKKREGCEVERCGHDMPQLPQSLWENDREGKWKLWWLRLAGLVPQLPPHKQRRKFCHIVGTSLHPHPHSNTHIHSLCYCHHHCSPARASSLPLVPSDKRRSNALQPPLWSQAQGVTYEKQHPHWIRSCGWKVGRTWVHTCRPVSCLPASSCLLICLKLTTACFFKACTKCHLSRRRAPQLFITNVPGSWKKKYFECGTKCGLSPQVCIYNLGLIWLLFYVRSMWSQKLNPFHGQKTCKISCSYVLWLKL